MSVVEHLTYMDEALGSSVARETKPGVDQRHEEGPEKQPQQHN